jgi:4-carboxymuconolactone decarboxylase
MARLDTPKREDLSPDAQAIWDQIFASRGAVQGPHTMLIHVPPLAEKVSDLGEYLRFKTLLPAPDRELAILATVREAGAQYAWIAHEAAGRRDGTRPAAIDIVRAKDGLDGLTPRERVIVEVVRSLVRTHQIPDDLFQRALAELGQEQLVEVVAIAGYYCMMGFVLNGFQVPIQQGAQPPF